MATAAPQPWTQAAVVTASGSAVTLHDMPATAAAGVLPCVTTTGLTAACNDWMSSATVRTNQERFGRLLGIIERQGEFAQALSSARPGRIWQVSVPFCGNCIEVPVLVNFLAQLLDGPLSKMGAVDVFCTDIHPSGAQVALATVQDDPRIRVRFQTMDLAREALPACDVVLGMHPEVTNSETLDLWEAIIATCVRAAPLAIFATLMDCEAQLVQRHASKAGSRARTCPGVAKGAMAGPHAGASSYDNMRFNHLVVAAR